jgi:hypothetical protein
LNEKSKEVSDITESLEKNVVLETSTIEDVPEKTPEKKPEEKKKKSFLTRLGESMLYHPWGFPY